MFKKITLEVSLKPFKKTDEESIRKVCEKIFEDWTPLIRNREKISVMLWCSDGGEILEYRCNPDDEIEWCRYLGTANLPHLAEGEDPATSLHSRSRIYMENPPVITYGTLKKIVSTLKETGKRRFPNAEILIGETFDIGPEFARSDFKYRRHPEITSGGSSCDKFGFIDATAALKAENRAYAAYPDGIPEGTPFGTFLGKQAQLFLADMGFDYLWLSNGLGFSADPWSFTGKIFDGKHYHPQKLNDTRDKVFRFWKLFRAECSFPLETRGTNNSVGIDYASDGVPLYDIYREGLDILPPPNSPWAAINGNFGLELMGHMTRICELPDRDYLFRFYLHDPWWVNSPWYDRYGSSPHDIYLPMAISRIDENGKCQSPTQLNILSIDNSYGDMPEACVYEPLPHFLKAEKNSPDEPAPFVWVYPMREYTRSHDEKSLKAMMEGDRFIEKAINLGFPLNCVASSDIFLGGDKEIYSASVIISPTPCEENLKKALLDFAAAGGKVILYGYAEELLEYRERGIFTVDISMGCEALFEGADSFGYHIRHVMREGCIKPPVMTIAKSDGAYFFSAFNHDTTTKTEIKLPIGAPAPIGRETEIKNSNALLNLGKWEHMECRVFVEQEAGVISCKEICPVNCKYRRKIFISGLENATVRLFPEAKLQGKCTVAEGRSSADGTPILTQLFYPVQDESYGYYLEARGVSGSFQFLLEHEDSPKGW